MLVIVFQDLIFSTLGLLIQLDKNDIVKDFREAISNEKLSFKDIANLFYGLIDDLFKIDDDLINPPSKKKKYSVYNSILLKCKYIYNKIFLNKQKFKLSEIEGVINYNNNEVNELKEKIDILLNYLEDKNQVEKVNYKLPKTFRAIVSKKDKDNQTLIVDTDNQSEVVVQLGDYFSEDFVYISVNSIINFINFDYDLNKNVYISNHLSLIVLEPDFKVDITDIASCFLANSYNPKINLLSKFEDSVSNEALFFGSVVNLTFDRLFENPDISLEEVVEIAAKQKILSSILINKNISFKKLKQKLKPHFETLKLTISDLKFSKVMLEPSFVSNKYGIQGRLDALLWKSKDEISGYEIIELKAGKQPEIDYQPKASANNLKGIWINHLIQILTYKVLLEEFILLESGTTYILYSVDKKYPFRFVDDNFEIRKEIFRIRNLIVAMDKSISKGNFNLLNKLTPKEFGPMPSYLYKKVNEFNKTIIKFGELEKSYFFEAISFLIKLQFDIKKQSNDVIFKDDVIYDLDLIKEELDSENMYLKFRMSNDEPNTFKVGDLVNIIYDNKIEGLIHKGYIKEITNDEIVVSLRNKLTIIDLFKRQKKWCIIRDKSDSLIKKLYPLLIKFLNFDYKNFLLGVEIPNNFANEVYKNNHLSFNQNQIIQNAINSEYYYLIQGPPGSGKTSRILINLIKYYLENNKKTIVFAFTNRAVDHIEAVLNKHKIENYIRLGTKVVESENLLANFTDKYTYNEITDKLKNCNLIISTISSLITQQEIFELFDSDIAIVDEASQILEIDLVSVLQHFKKFILIGDEKQLPAVCPLVEEIRQVENEHLRKVDLLDFGESLFSRLLRINKKQNSKNFAMLFEQGRMNKKIMDLSNKLYYDNKLKLVQNGDNSFPICDTLLFLDNTSGRQFKVDDFEVETIIEIIEYLLKCNVLANQIGVISPFRLQCNNIIKSKKIFLENDIMVDTIERFQGNEKDVIILSLATNTLNLISNISSTIDLDGFLVDRKLNVAITRAKKVLIVIGNSKVLKQNESYEKFVDYFVENDLFVKLDDFRKNITQYLPENN